MADGTREDPGHGPQSADEAALAARLRHLGERLDHLASRPSDRDTVPRPAGEPSALGRALRLSTEFVAGVLFGAFLGWLIDRWLGISPWGLIVFLMLGFAAGVLNLIRAARSASGGPPSRGAARGPGSPKD